MRSFYVAQHVAAIPYVAGVLACELDSRFPSEARRALAVCIQTYAAYRNDVDRAVLWSTERDQVFGIRPPTEDDYRVATEMVGWEMQYLGKPILAQYSAACGGSTVTVPGLPYLQGVACDCGHAINGHRRGLCQLGAVAEAKAGWDWRRILQHYYTDVKILRV